MTPHYTNTNNPIDFPKSENNMNERMKLKIEREIWPQCISNVTTDTDKVMKNYFDKYKFAELIVRECVSLRTELTQFDSTDPYGDGYENGLKDMAELMVEHFGVEE